jgi:hypothetical protein
MSKSLNKSNISDYFSSKVASVKAENLSPIDEKRISKDDVDKPKKKEANWGKFAKDAFVSLLSALLFVYMGASIIGFSKYYLFNKIGGTNENGPPYKPDSTREKRSKKAGFTQDSAVPNSYQKSRGVAPTPYKAIGGRSLRKGGMKIPNTLQARLASYYKTIFGLDSYAFPYKNSLSEEKGDGLVKDIVTWITDSIAFSFSTGRKSLETILSLIGQTIYGSNCKTMESCKVDGFSGNLIEVVALIGIPLTIIFLSVIPVVPVCLGLFTMGTMAYSFFTDLGKVITLDAIFVFGLFFFYSWIWMWILGSISSLSIGLTFLTQFILLNLFIFIGPLLEKTTRTNIKEVFIKRLPFVFAVVAWFMSQSAFEDLGETGGWVVTGSAIGCTLLSIYGLFTGNKSTPAQSIPKKV